MHTAFEWVSLAFSDGLVREPYERSLYERTFLNEPFIEKRAITRLSYPMLIERNTSANRILYVDLIVKQAEYQ